MKLIFLLQNLRAALRTGNARLGQRGTTALEFAITFPVLCTLAFGILSNCIGMWIWNVLQEGASETARCLAIDSTLCSTVPTGCDSTLAGVCYAERVATSRGVSNVSAADVTVSAAAACGLTGSTGFTLVTYKYSFSLIGYALPITASACYPNNS